MLDFSFTIFPEVIIDEIYKKKKKKYRYTFIRE